MDGVARAVLGSWTFDPLPLCGLSAGAMLYLRGWKKLHRELPQRYTGQRLASFLTGLLVIVAAVASPLDAFAGMLLQVHMAQHLLLMMAAPILIWNGQPVLPILRGLPGGALKEGLGPFLRWPLLQRAARGVVHPAVCWLAMTFTVVFWHQPRWYELALGSPAWHRAEHGFFLGAALLFWFPVVGVWPAKPAYSQWLLIPYLVLADLVNTGLSAWLVFSGHVLYPTYAAAPRLWGISAMADQTTAGALMWVPGSIVYLIPAFLLTLRALNGKAAERGETSVRRAGLYQRPEPWDLLRTWPGRVFGHRHVRTGLRLATFAGAVAILISGFRDRGVPAPLTLAGVLPWTYFRGFGILAILAAGNLVCMACPFSVTRYLGQRLGQRLVQRLLPGTFRWPAGLRSKWLPAGLVGLYFWAYEAFALWDSAWLTAWLVAGYFLASFLIDGLFGASAFCRYVCPVGQFQFVNSLVSPLEVRAKSPAVCGECTTHDCLRGNSVSRGCTMLLFQPVKSGNMDCTFCLDCVTACPEGNIGILRSAPANPAKARPDVAALACVVVAGGLVNAAGMTGPVMMALHRVHAALGMASFLPVITGWYALGLLVPAALLARAGKVAAGNMMALIPLGASLWAAHLGWHLVTGWTALMPGLARFAAVPGWLMPAQLLLLDGGLMLTLWRLWRKPAPGTAGVSWWTLISAAYFGAAVWVVLQPMEMRGMVMTR